jgi:hypothetical protein
MLYLMEVVVLQLTGVIRMLLEMEMYLEFVEVFGMVALVLIVIQVVNVKVLIVMMAV